MCRTVVIHKCSGFLLFVLVGIIRHGVLFVETMIFITSCLSFCSVGDEFVKVTIG